MSNSDLPLDLFDLASETLGGTVLWANDDFFAEKENLLRAAAPVWKEDVYTDRGKWMDGWESRRRRTPGHDSCIIRLGVPGTIAHIVVDTAFFRGNFPESCSIEGCAMSPEASVEELLACEDWVELLEKSVLQGHNQERFPIESRLRFTHLRLHIYPDGGVARLRVYGNPVPDPQRARGTIDLASVLQGGATLAQSDMFFGHAQNLLKPERGKNMGDGWETKRRRGPGHDWVLLRLADEGQIDRVEVDTHHFKGNYPDRFSLELYDQEPDDPATPNPLTTVIEHRKLQAHTAHLVDLAADDNGTTHVVLRIYPDGGVSRLRLWGQLTDLGQSELALRYLNALHDHEARAMFLSCCGSGRWADGMVDELPFASFADVRTIADQLWAQVDDDDRLEAFRAHPRIGATAGGSRWSSGEQAAAATTSDDAREALAQLNDAYFDKHGFIFIICATGKTAGDVQAALEQRVGNTTEVEIFNAAAEQALITQLRLTKWLQGN